MRHARRAHAHQPRPDFHICVRNQDLFLVVDVVHITCCIGRRAGGIQDPGPHDVAARRFQFQVEVVDERGIGVECCFVIIPSQRHRGILVRIGNDEIVNVHFALRDTFLPERLARDEVDRRVDVHLPEAPLVVRAGIAKINRRLHQDCLGGGGPESAGGVVDVTVMLEHQSDAAGHSGCRHRGTAHHGVSVHRIVIRRSNPSIASRLAGSGRHDGLDAAVLGRPPRGVRVLGVVVGIGAADVDGVLGRGRWGHDRIGAARGRPPAFVAGSPGRNVLIADANDRVAAAHDLVDEDRGGAIFAHNSAAIGIVVRIDIGSQAGSAQIGPIPVLRLRPVVFDVGNILVKEVAAAGVGGAIRDQVGVGRHATPLQDRAALSRAVCPVAADRPGDVRAVRFRCLGVAMDQARAEIDVVAGLPAVVDQDVNPRPVEVVGRRLYHVHADLLATAVVSAFERRRSRLNPLHGILRRQRLDVGARHLHDEHVQAYDFAGNRASVLLHQGAPGLQCLIAVQDDVHGGNAISRQVVRPPLAGHNRRSKLVVHLQFPDPRHTGMRCCLCGATRRDRGDPGVIGDVGQQFNTFRRQCILRRLARDEVEL